MTRGWAKKIHTKSIVLKLLNMNEKKNKIRADGGEKMKKQQAILFDLDGTLLNTLDDLTSSECDLTGARLSFAEERRNPKISGEWE